MKINGVLISEGNRKLGAIPSVSLHPKLSCGKGCTSPLLCMKDCYAMKMLGYTSVAPGWTQNYHLWQENPSAYFAAIRDFLYAKQPKRFRWHVGGDIPDASYLNHVVYLAKIFPHIAFRAFTKADKFLPDEHPKVKNLKIGISRWPGMSIRPGLTGYTYSWIIPNTASKACREGRLTDAAYKIPKSALNCPGNCESCAACWTMRAGSHVKFEQH
jgi:hypothetical protein